MNKRELTTLIAERTGFKKRTFSKLYKPRLTAFPRPYKPENGSLSWVSVPFILKSEVRE